MEGKLLARGKLRRQQTVLRNGIAAGSTRTKTETHRNYLLYRKTANATRTTVMIHRIMFLLPLFSSAMAAVQHRPSHASSAAPDSALGTETRFQWFDAGLPGLVRI